jgi:hypothetical protein
MGWRQRTILSPEITKLLSRLFTKIETSVSPSVIHIFALAMGFAVCLMKICIREKLLQTTKAALYESVIKFIPKGLQIVIRNQKIIRSYSNNHAIGLEATSPHLLLSDYSADLLYELVAFQTFEAIMTYLCIDEMKPYIENREIFGEIPLSMSVLHVCMQFKHNQNIQRQGLYIICYFARSGVELSVVIDKSPEVLESIISNLKRDVEVVSQFLFILSLIIHSKRGPTSLTVDYTLITASKLDMHLISLIIGNYIGAEDVISALTSFKHLSCSPTTCAVISQSRHELPAAIIRILESPNTNPSLAVILALTGYTNLFQNESAPQNSDPVSKRLLKSGKNRLTTMLKNDEPVPEYFTRKDIEKLISKCSHAEKCVLS